MSYPGLSQPSYFGGIHGGHWQALAQAQRNSFAAAHFPYCGAYATLLAGAQSTEQPRASAIEDAGIRAGEIIGSRIWQVRGGCLHSVITETPWPFDEPLVTEPDRVEVGLGVFAFKTPAQALEEYGYLSNIREIVIGKVAMWGLVIEHERGYRAEFAKPVSFTAYLGGRWWRRGNKLDALRKNYGLVP